MTIHFEFTMSDIDASNLIDIIDREINKVRDTINLYTDITNPTRADIANRDWYVGHADYLCKLKQTILDGNRRVE